MLSLPALLPVAAPRSHQSLLGLHGALPQPPQQPQGPPQLCAKQHSEAAASGPGPLGLLALVVAGRRQRTLMSG